MNIFELYGVTPLLIRHTFWRKKKANKPQNLVDLVTPYYCFNSLLNCCYDYLSRAPGGLSSNRGNLEYNPFHEFHETCHSVTVQFMKKDPKRCCDTSTPESIHTKDESKRGSAFAFIFGVN